MRRTSAFFARWGLAALVAGACAHAAAAQGADATWERLTGPIDPPPAREHQIVHDPVRHRMLLLDGGLQDELWELPLPATGPTTWRRVAIAGNTPGQRWGFSAVYDPLQDRVILFGGTTFDPILQREVYCNDVWSLSLSGAATWSLIATSGTPPTERTGAVAVFDPARDRLILFGGYTSGGGLDETWSLELGAVPTWRLLTPLGARKPAGRVEAAAVYDPWNDRMVLFGGVSRDEVYLLGKNDVWALTLAGQTRWDSLAVASPPPGRSGCVAVLDSLHQQMVVSSGAIGSNTSYWLTDTWAFDLVGNRHWTQLPAVGPLPAVTGASAAFSPERNSLIQYGGDHDPYQSECDELSLATNEWSRIEPDQPHPSPTRRGLSTLIVDPDAERLLVFGGLGWGCQHDLWAYGLGETRGWTQLPTIGIAQVCGASYFVFDPRRRRLLAFGTFDAPWRHASLDEVWALPLDEPRVWTPLAPVGALPPMREHASFAYDSRRDRVLMFGGEILLNGAADNGESQDDVWALSLADSLRWRQLTPVGTPGPRQEAAALYDAAHDRLIVMQGEHSHPCTYYCSQDLDDTWALSLAGDSLVWRRFGPDAPVRSEPMLDPRRDRLVMWDGAGSAWALSLSAPEAWQPLTLRGDGPMPRQYVGQVFDPTRDRLFVFGGYLDKHDAADGTFTSDLLALRFASEPPVAAPPTLALVGALPNPAVRDLSLAFSLLDGSPARLDVFDLAGRRVAAREVGTLGAGRHVLPMGRFAPGVYVVRLTQGSRTATLRAAVIR